MACGANTSSQVTHTIMKMIIIDKWIYLIMIKGSFFNRAVTTIISDGEVFTRDDVPARHVVPHLLDSRSIEKQFQGGLVFKARRLLYHSTLGRE